VSILLIIVYVLVCLFLVMVVLLQQGSGADLAGAFGGGGTQASFGPRSSTNIMHRMTTVSFVLFVVLSMALAVLSGKRRASYMEDVPKAEPVAQVEVQTGGTDGSTIGAPEEAETTPGSEAGPAAVGEAGETAVGESSAAGKLTLDSRRNGE